MKTPSACSIAAVLTTIGLLALAAACGGNSAPRGTKATPSAPCNSLADLFVQSTVEPIGTPATGDSLTRPTAPVGSAVLFDLRNGASTRLDLGNYYDAEWIDDCRAVLAGDPEAKIEAAIDLQGNIIHEVFNFDEKTPADDGAGFVIPYVVHDGRSLVIERFVARGVAPDSQLVDIFSGTAVNLQGSYLPEFSPDGQAVVRYSLDQSNQSAPDPASARVQAAIVAKDCAQGPPYSCVAWRPALLDSPRSKKINGSARWSVDAAYVFFRLGEPCPDPPQRGSGCLNRSSLAVEVYDARTHDLVFTLQLPSAQSKVQWAGHNLVVDSGANPPSDRWQLVGLDGKATLLPASLKGQTWFSPDGQYAVSWISEPFTERRCALLDAGTGREIASVSGLPPLRRGQEMCRHVSWTRDGSYALVTDGNDDRDD